VEAYGAIAALTKVAQVSVRDPRSLIVTVFDAGMASSVEKAIRNAGLNLNPSAGDGAGRITVPVPKSTLETREAMKKVAYTVYTCSVPSIRHTCTLLLMA
jgi:ribosome recycling factor